ncbi:MAG: hypothetical protein QXV62_04335 [Nitrososphaerota archaeon]
MPAYAFRMLMDVFRRSIQRGLDRALEFNSELAHACGFMEKTPSQPTISRFMDRMGEAGISLAMRLMVI